MKCCPKCGKEVTNETQKFCVGCGAPLQENKENKVESATVETQNAETAKADETPVEKVAEPTPTTDVPYNASTQKEGLVDKIKSMDVKVLAIVVVAIIAVIILFNMIFGGKAYLDPVNNYLKLLNNRNTDYVAVQTALSGDKLGNMQKDLLDILKKADAEIYSDYTIKDMIDESNDNLEDFYDDADDEFEKWKIKFEEKKAKKMDKDDLKDLADDLADEYEDTLDSYTDMLEDEDEIEDTADQMNIDEKDVEKFLKASIKSYEYLAEGKISEAYEVRGKFIIESKDDTLKTDTIKFVVAKIDGSWVYIPQDHVDFDDDDDDIFYPVRRSLNNGTLSIF